jgi:hypothetical protein
LQRSPKRLSWSPTITALEHRLARLRQKQKARDAG